MSVPVQIDKPSLECHRESLHLFARLNLHPHLRCKLDASDIVQETLLKASEKLGHFRGQADVEVAAWLRQILINTLGDSLRAFGSQKRDIALETALAHSSSRLEALLGSANSSPSAQAVRHEEFDRLARALAQLPDDQRAIVELHHLHDWSVPEIAEHYGRTEPAIAGLLRRGLKKLREFLRDPRGGEP